MFGLVTVWPPAVVSTPNPLIDAEHTDGEPVQVMVVLSGSKHPGVLAVAALQLIVTAPLDPPPFRPVPAVRDVGPEGTGVVQEPLAAQYWIPMPPGPQVTTCEFALLEDVQAVPPFSVKDGADNPA